MPGTLYIVATPIGNLDDITLRALRILRDEVTLIACEDTRQTAKLLTHFAIRKPLISYHEHNEESRTAELIERLNSGASVALVSDAGTPLLSDPGYRIVKTAIENDIAIVPVPGASAALSALVVSGLATDSFFFIGFLPPKPLARRKRLESLLTLDATLVAYESPHRILETLEIIAAVSGERPLVLAREITKVHEEFLRGSATSILEQLTARPSIKGEITLLIGRSEALPAPLEDAAAEVDRLARDGVPRMEAIKAVAKRLGLPKREVYRLVEEQGNSPEDKSRG